MTDPYDYDAASVCQYVLSTIAPERKTCMRLKAVPAYPIRTRICGKPGRYMFYLARKPNLGIRREFYCAKCMASMLRHTGFAAKHCGDHLRLCARK